MWALGTLYAITGAQVIIGAVAVGFAFAAWHVTENELVIRQFIVFSTALSYIGAEFFWLRQTPDKRVERRARTLVGISIGVGLAASVAELAILLSPAISTGFLIFPLCMALWLLIAASDGLGTKVISGRGWTNSTGGQAAITGFWRWIAACIILIAVIVCVAAAIDTWWPTKTSLASARSTDWWITIYAAVQLSSPISLCSRAADTWFRDGEASELKRAAKMFGQAAAFAILGASLGCYFELLLNAWKGSGRLPIHPLTAGLGAAFAFIITLFWQRRREQREYSLDREVPGSRRGRTSQVLDGIGGLSSDVGGTVSQLVAFVKGGLWLLLAAFVIRYSWFPKDAFDWIIFGLGIVALGKGLSYIGPVLRRPMQMPNSKVHGGAGKATQAKSLDAARGGVEKPPWADHGYSD
jgi:hypothetical protein